MRVLHLSDTHLVAPGAPFAHPELPAPQERLATVLDAARAHGPFVAVVLTGDLCDDGSREGALAVRDLVAPLAPLVVAVPGNHDDTETIRDVFGMPFGHLGAWRLTGAATNVAGEVAGVAAPVCTLLDALVDTPLPTLLLLHHPLRSRSTHAWFTLAGAAELQERLERHTAPLVLASGHTHEAYDAVVGGARLLGAPSTYYGIAHDGDAWAPVPGTTGARVIDLHDDGTLDTWVVRA